MVMGSLVWKLSALMEYREELVKVDTLMEYHEEFVDVDTLMEYHEELVDVVTRGQDPDSEVQVEQNSLSSSRVSNHRWLRWESLRVS